MKTAFSNLSTRESFVKRFQGDKNAVSVWIEGQNKRILQNKCVFKCICINVDIAKVTDAERPQNSQVVTYSYIVKLEGWQLNIFNSASLTNKTNMEDTVAEKSCF